jgi:putative transferase (TIGR04331 family)
MTDVPRQLILTSCEEMWVNKSPLLLLGSWCASYRERDAIKKMANIKMAAPFVMSAEEQLEKIKELDLYSSQLLVDLSKFLNDHHGVKEDLRYWEIIMGHWVRNYTSVLMNRYHTLEKALCDNRVDSAVVSTRPMKEFIKSDFASTIYICSDEAWNHAIYSSCLNFMDKDLNLDIKKEKSASLPIEDKNLWAVGARVSMESIYYKLSDTWNRWFVRPTDPFIIKTYLSRSLEYRFKWANGTSPLPWSLPPNLLIVPNLRLREKSHEKFYDQSRGISGFLRHHVMDMIPTCYIEGFDEMNSLVNSLPWPSSPRYIFTSNSFLMNEPFKFWVAGKVQMGVPYYTGQHGNNYGTHLFNGNRQAVERTTSDKFLTWGWKDDCHNTTPAFNFKAVECKEEPYSKSGGLLLIEFPPPNQTTIEDSFFLYEQYLEEQFDLVRGLEQKIKESLLVRFHSSPLASNWSLRQRWEDFNAGVKIDSGSKNINKLIRGSRLVVHSYDSTGILETLFASVPTVAFWQNGMDHLLPAVKPDYQKLVDAKIVFFSPKELSAHINQHWDDFDAWWQSDKVQHARKDFCAVYSRDSNDPIGDLNCLLT